MAAFRVGQRVRVVYAGTSVQLIGAEAKIIGGITHGSGRNGPYLGYPTSLLNIAGRVFIAHPSWIEPIQPEGMKPASWSDCLWQPEHMRATS